MYLRIANKEQFNALVKSLTSNIKKLNKPTKAVNRHDVERIVAPAVSGGKEHGALVAELKSNPKTPTGVVMSKASDQLSKNVSNLAAQIEQIKVYQGELETALDATNIELSSTFEFDLCEDGDLPKESIVYKTLSSLEEALKGANRNKIFNLSISGLNEPVDWYDFGGEAYQATFTLAWADHSFKVEARVEYAEDAGRQVEYIDHIWFNGVDITDIEKNEAELFAKDIDLELITDSIATDWVRGLLERAATDMCNEIGDSVSPELMMMLVEELN